MNKKKYIFLRFLIDLWSNERPPMGPQDSYKTTKFVTFTRARHDDDDDDDNNNLTC